MFSDTEEEWLDILLGSQSERDHLKGEIHSHIGSVCLLFSAQTYCTLTTFI